MEKLLRSKEFQLAGKASKLESSIISRRSKLGVVIHQGLLTCFELMA